MIDIGSPPLTDDGSRDSRKLDTKALERAFDELGKTLKRGEEGFNKLAVTQRSAAQAALNAVAGRLPLLPAMGGMLELSSLSALSGTLELLESLPDRVSANAGEVADALDELEAAIEQFEEVPALYSDFTERQVSSANNLLEQLKLVSEQVLSALPDQLDDLSETIEETIVTEAASLNETLIENTRETIVSTLENIQGMSHEAGSVLTNVATGMLDRLGDRARGIIEQEFGGAIEDFAQDAVLDALTEIGAGMLITQLSAQVTSALSAQLPQLIVAKNAVGAVRRLLEIARAGI
ncbi:hypothetical protein RLEG3_12335 [Rhizobium leguminosarum bv. trifolii WSM1689]|uniref:hypothetical protein n=1 Tax=Rhizobium leguminosarum TaxID=384 RepID=UPI0003E0B3C2|nr:hypothetical protein [Rhizobium leguminosarum]AHF86639.1 hypothetical protein RLEG3_12335 [Rhizobium leguminosarum bv. trifolii WSM1689]